MSNESTYRALIQVRVSRIDNVARDVKAFELMPLHAETLPPFTPGAHLTVFLPQGFARKYSLCGDPLQQKHYTIAVLRQTGFGSTYMHDVLEIGDTLEISHPRNHFPLAQDGTNYLLIAGGIGVTPLLSMAKELASRGAPFSFLYCARTRERSAYIDQLEALCTKGQLALHFDGGDPKRQFDIRSLVQSAGRDTHVYCCGPTSLMKAVRDCTREWSPRTVHFEDFSSGNSNGQFEDDGFEIVLRKRGIKLVVPPGKSIVRVLLEHGVQVDTSCEAGTCGTCRTRYLSGNPIHNDFVLTEQEQSQFVMICCARATDTPLVLDL